MQPQAHSHYGGARNYKSQNNFFGKYQQLNSSFHAPIYADQIGDGRDYPLATFAAANPAWQNERSVSESANGNAT